MRKKSKNHKKIISLARTLTAVITGVVVIVVSLGVIKAPTAFASGLGCTTPIVNEWRNYSFTSQTGAFTVEFNGIPLSSTVDSVIGVGNGPASTFEQLAAIVRFNGANRKIEARNGGSYYAAGPITYSAGRNFHFRLVINVATHQYSAYVTPAGDIEKLIGKNLAFRSDQATVAALSYWTIMNDVDRAQICDWIVKGPGLTPDTQAPSIPQNVAASAISNTEIKISWSGASDNVSVAGYKLYQDGILMVTTQNLATSYTISGLTAPTTHTYKVAAYDMAGNASAISTGKTATIAAPLVNPYDSIVLVDNPIAFWDLTSAGTEADLSGHGNIGSYKNGLPGAATMPNGDRAAAFNGTQYFTVPSNPSFSIPTTGNLTWEAWIRPDVLQFPQSPDGYIDFMGKCEQYGPTCEWEARMYDLVTPQVGRSSRISAYAFNPSAGLGSAADWQPVTGIVQAGKWIHVVGEYTTKSEPSNCQNIAQYPGSINIWVNGVLWNQSAHQPTGCMSQFNVIPKSNNSALNIGTMAFDYWFHGAIGKVAIYNYQLSNAQIATHYKTMTGISPSGSCGLVTCTFGL